MQPDELIEKPMSPMHYARSGLGTAEMNGKLIAAGKNKDEWFLVWNLQLAKPLSGRLFTLACDMQTFEEKVQYAFLSIPLYYISEDGEILYCLPLTQCLFLIKNV